MEKNFSRCTVLGCACVITSTLTVDQLEQYKLYHPEALSMAGEDGETLFIVDLDDQSPGSLSPEKAVFSRTTTPDGRATITIVLDPAAEDKMDLVRRKLGTALLRLEELEEHLLENVVELQKEVSKIDSMISRS